MPNVFPTLSETPSIELWEEGLAFDPTIRTPLESGHVRTGVSCTHVPGMWKLSYRAAPTVDKNLIRQFEKDMKVGAGKFSWTNPDPGDGATYNVRFRERVAYKMHETVDYWDMDMILEEV